MLKPSHPRYELLDAWRGIACLMVVANHSIHYLSEDQAAGNWLYRLARLGWIGVPIFFVISGYCISAAADSARRKQTGFATYFWRRFRRIFPPYWAALLLTCVMSLVLERTFATGLLEDSTHDVFRLWWLQPSGIAGNLTLTDTWLPRITGTPSRLVLGQAWTLCYEEQFYAIMGIMLACFSKRLFAVSAVLTLATIPFFGNFKYSGFFFFGPWMMFAVGILVYHSVNYQNYITRLLSIAAIAGLAVTCALVCKQSFGLDNDPLVSLIVAAMFGVLLIVARPLDSRLSASRWMQPLMWCGAMCYSLYLIHWPLVKIVSNLAFRAGLTGAWSTMLVTVPLCVAASLAAGRIFYIGIERRFLNTPTKAIAAEQAIPTQVVPA